MRATPSLLLLALPLAATAVVYAPLISVYFNGDDFLHLFAIVDADRAEYLLRPHGGHLLMTRNAVFIAFHTLFGMRADLYFWVVLLTHLMNTLLFFRIVAHWTESGVVAAFGALLWGVCPTHAGTLAWYSVYGQVLVGTILLVILHQASRADHHGRTLPRSAVVIWPPLFVVASTCFGVGIGLTLIAPVALYFLLPASRERFVVCLILLAIAAITPTAYQALIAYHDRLTGSTAGTWAMAMSIGGLHYWSTILIMFAYLMSCSVSDLLLGFAAASAGFPSPWATLTNVVYVAITLSAFVLAPTRARARLIGLLLLAVGCYGVIAAGRATLLSTFKLAAAAAITRYHYVGTIPLGILLCCALAQLTGTSRHAAVIQYGVLWSTIALITVLYLRSHAFIDPHLTARTETMNVVERIRVAIDETPSGTEVRIPNRPFASVGVMLRDFRSGFPGWAGVFTLFFPDNVVDGKPVRFVVSDPAIVQAVATGRRSHDLFVVGAVAPEKPRAAQRPGAH